MKHTTALAHLRKDFENYDRNAHVAMIQNDEAQWVYNRDIADSLLTTIYFLQNSVDTPPKADNTTPDMKSDTTNPIRTEPVYATLKDLFAAIAQPCDECCCEPAEPQYDENEYLRGYLAGISSLADHLQAIV